MAITVKHTELMDRDVTESDLELLGTQDVEMKIGSIKCEHRILVSDLSTPGDGIMGVDLLQFAGASVDLEVGCLRIGDYKIHPERRDSTVLAAVTLSDKDKKEMY